jgi:hypothetical protein
MKKFYAIALMFLALLILCAPLLLMGCASQTAAQQAATVSDIANVATVATQDVDALYAAGKVSKSTFDAFNTADAALQPLLLAYEQAVVTGDPNAISTAAFNAAPTLNALLLAEATAKSNAAVTASSTTKSATVAGANTGAK